LFGIEGGGMGHWQTFVEGFGWLTLPENGYYFGGTNSDNGGIHSVSCENQNQLFRVIESELGCIDTSGVIAIPLIAGCEFSTCDSTVIVVETVYDTVLISVTDTLIIDLTLTDVNSSEVLNTLSIYPNPSSTHITIDYGNFALISGYQLSIENSVGQQVFQTFISQPADYLSLSTWGGNGMYFVHIIDPQGNTIDVRKIVIE
jgi:hypothetical protein